MGFQYHGVPLLRRSASCQQLTGGCSPVDMNRNAIVMELMDATPLNRVQEIDRPDKVYNTLMELIVRLANHGLVHCDFNEFNLMIGWAAAARREAFLAAGLKAPLSHLQAYGQNHNDRLSADGLDRARERAVVRCPAAAARSPSADP